MSMSSHHSQVSNKQTNKLNCFDTFSKDYLQMNKQFMFLSTNKQTNKHYKDQFNSIHKTNTFFFINKRLDEEKYSIADIYIYNLKLKYLFTYHRNNLRLHHFGDNLAKRLAACLERKKERELRLEQMYLHVSSSLHEYSLVPSII